MSTARTFRQQAESQEVIPFRQPPYSLEAEASILGGMLMDNAMIDEVSAILKAQDFYRDVHQVLYRAIVDVRGKGSPVDAILLWEHLRRGEHAADFEDGTIIAAIGEATPHAANTVHYARLVREKAISRELIEASERTIRDCYSHQFDAEELIEQAESRIFAIDDDRATGQTSDLDEAIAEATSAINRRMDGEIVGVSTGFSDVDDVLGGLAPGTLTILAGRPSMGKAQPLSARVLTPSGFVEMGLLEVGDTVIGRDGAPCRVTGVFPQGELPVFRVTTKDGGSTLCCEEHLWFTQTRNERRIGSPGSVKALREIAKTLHRNGSSPNHALPNLGIVEFADDGPRPIDPYALGLLLGDGSFRSSNVRFTNPERDICLRLANSLPDGDELHHAEGIEYRVRRRRRNGQVSDTRLHLAQLGLMGKDSKSKFIPSAYLLAPPEVRLSLLQGLLDTDGYVTDGGQSVEFTTSSPSLAWDVSFLVRSLGGIVSCRVRIPAYSHLGEHREGAESSRMVIRFPNGLPIVSSEKHMARWKGGASRYHRSIASIEPAGLKPCQCISVDASDHLYVTDDFIVTHNTALALNICEHAALAGDRPYLSSMEMGRVEVAQRMLQSRARIDGSKLRKAWHLTDDDRERLRLARQELAAVTFPIDDTASRNVAQIAANARRLKARRNIGLVVVDYLQLIDADGDTREQQVAAVSRRLKALARELHVPVLALSQLNRGVENREDKRPRMSDLRESGAIEQDADTILFIHRPDYYDPADRPGVAELIISKNRNGETSTVELVFLRHIARFDNLSPIGATYDPAFDA